MSGLTPGVTLRKTFISASSPNATDELDCSPEKSVEWASMSRSWPGSRWNMRSPRTSDGGAGATPCRANAASHSAIAWRSCSAS